MQQENSIRKSSANESIMNRYETYPLLIAHPVIRNKEKKILVIYTAHDASGYKMEGDVAEICMLFNGRRKLQDILNQFLPLQNKKTYDLADELGKILLILEENKLIDYLTEPLP